MEAIKIEERKKLGKINSVKIGACGYQEAMFGVVFDFSLAGGTTVECTQLVGAWNTKRTEDCEWTEESRIEGIGNAFNELRLIMKTAKVDEVRKLEGIPIEATFEGNHLKNWRVLEEVL